MTSIIKLIVIIFSVKILSILIYINIIFEKEIQLISLYNFGLITTLFFFIFLIFTKKNLRNNLFFSFVIFVLSIYSLEKYLQFYNNKNFEIESRINKAKKLNKNYDDRSKLEIVQDLRKEIGKAAPTYHPSNFLYKFNKEEIKKINKKFFLPLTGQSNIQTVYNNENGKYCIYKSDRYGFNNPDYIWDEEKIDIALIGDSYTHGSAVDQGLDIAGQLRILMNKNVLNLGVGGSGPLIQLSVFSEYIKKIKPKKVIWIFYLGNDFENLNFEKNYPIFLEYLYKNLDQNLIQRQSEIDSWLSLLFSKLEKEKMNKKRSFLTLPAVRNLIHKSLVTKDIQKIKEEFLDVDLLDKILIKVKNDIDSWGGELIFVNMVGYNELIIKNKFNNKKKIKLKEVLNKNKIPMIDIENFLKKKKELISLFPLQMEGGHYTAEGYHYIANRISESLKTISYE